MLTKFVLFLLATTATVLQADSITWGSTGGSASPTNDGFVIDISGFGYSVASSNLSGSRDFTLDAPETLILTETVDLNFSGFPCNPGGCPDSLSGSYSAFTNFGLPLAGSNAINFTQGGPTLASFTLDGTATETLALGPGTYDPDAWILAIASGGDPAYNGTDIFSAVLCNNVVPEPRWQALFLGLIAALGIASQRLQRKHWLGFRR